MRAFQLTEHGGHDALHLARDLPQPTPGPGEVLIAVSASSVNNTDINTRVGWYAEQQAGSDTVKGGWGGSSLGFPRVQGTDIAGYITEVGSGVSPARIGERVIVQPCLTSLAVNGVSPWIGSERDGGFADYAVAPSEDTHAVDGPLSDLELGAIPCAFGTAMNMLLAASVSRDDRVLITGVSGNVGLAALQLARLTGATVEGIASPEKAADLLDLGLAQVHPRDTSQIAADSFDVVIDLVGGPVWPDVLRLLKPQGRLAISGAIGGAITDVDLRKLYLKNLTLLGRTEQSRSGFLKLVELLREGRVRPLLHAVYPLSQLVEAQVEFERRSHLGKIVIDVTAEN